MQRLEDQIVKAGEDIQEAKEKAEKENDPALKLQAEKQLTLLIQEKILLMK